MEHKAVSASSFQVPPQIYKAWSPGACAAVCLAKFYFDRVYVISRVNYLGETWSRAQRQYVPHWVVRFLRSGNGVIDDRDAELVLHRVGRGGKGEAAKRFQLTHFVDDSLDCLWSILQDEYGNAKPWIIGGNGKLVMYFNDRMRGDEELKEHYDRVVRNSWYARDAEALLHIVRPAQTRQSVVAHLGLKPPLGAWRWFGPRVY